MWPDRRILDLFGIELPILQAPMAGSSDAALAIAVSAAGGLGALPCAMFTPVFPPIAASTMPTRVVGI